MNFNATSPPVVRNWCHGLMVKALKLLHEKYSIGSSQRVA